MVKLATLTRLAALEQEMARDGRRAEEAALRDALRDLARPANGMLTTGRAADRLHVSIPTVKRWIERGALAGGHIGERWLVSPESVERLVRLRTSLAALDEEGHPTAEEIAVVARQQRDPRIAQEGKAAGA